MSKAKAAAAVVAGLLLTVVALVGILALIVTALADVYTGGLALWLGLPLLLVVGAAVTVYGIVLLIREVSDAASEASDLTDLEGPDDVKNLRKLYKRID